MTLCVKTGYQCVCQPDEGVFCPDYKPDEYVQCLMNAITELLSPSAGMVKEERYFWVNGSRKRWNSFSHFNGDLISYDDVVEWSGRNSDSDVIRDRVYTVTYAMPQGSSARDGSLIKGESVAFEVGMVFNVTRTTSA